MMGRQVGRQGRDQTPMMGIVLAGIVGALILVVGLITIFGGDSADSAPTPTAAIGDTGGQNVRVLVANSDIEGGAALEAGMFRLEERGPDFAADGYLTNAEQLKGTFAQSFIAAGHPVRSEFVSFRQPSSAVEVAIPEGYRAVSVVVDPVTSVEGWARPGAKVDVVVVSQRNGDKSIQSVVQNAKVLPGGGKGGPGGAITLLVTEAEASKIIFATHSGTLSLALRGDEDDAEGAFNSTVKLSDIVQVQGQQQEQGCPDGKLVIDGLEFCIVQGKPVPVGNLR